MDKHKKYRSFFLLDIFILKCLLSTQAFTFSTKSTIPNEWREKTVAYLYSAASWLTEPLCTAHRLYRQTLIVDELFPTASQLENRIRKSTLLLGSVAQVLLTPITTLPGIELRFMAACLQDRPFIHFRGWASEKELNDRSFSLLTWNLCCVTGGYSITEGGVLPWMYRKEHILWALLNQNPDILCLYEIFDIQTALWLIEELKDKYAHFYFHMGPSVIGLSSGLFVASKFPVSEPEFIPFPQNALYGRSKHCKKGVFSFDVAQGGTTFARIFTTHFQHSERPDHPVTGELEARRREMEIILEKIESTENTVCILTGDLNLEDREYNISSWKENFEKGSVRGEGYTWGGDQFCATLVGKSPSCPANLDHTLLKKGMGATISTSYIETGFQPDTFKTDALSDHKGLFSIISLSSLVD